MCLQAILPGRFIERNGLPQSYKEQIVQWILDNTGGAVGASAPTTNVDPFTGGGAYVPGASSFPQPGSHNNDSIYANADPFTGGALVTHLQVPHPSKLTRSPMSGCNFA